VTCSTPERAAGCRARPRPHLGALPAARRGSSSSIRAWRSRAAPPVAPGSNLGILERTDRILDERHARPARAAGQPAVHRRWSCRPRLMGMHLTSPVVHSTGRTVGRPTSSATGRTVRATSASNGISPRPTSTHASASRPGSPTPRSSVSSRRDGTDGRPSTTPSPASTFAASWQPTRSTAVFTTPRTATTAAYPPVRVRFPGLDPARRYRSPCRRTAPNPGTSAAQSPLAWRTHPVVPAPGQEKASTP